jgi:hypothetical protein
VKRPRRSRAPPNVSRMPANPSQDSSGTVPPVDGEGAGKAKCFIVPVSMNIAAAMIRSTLNRYGAQSAHVVAIAFVI